MIKTTVAVFLFVSLKLTFSSNSLQLLVLVPWPSDRDDAGWDAGLDLLTGGRVAVNEINNTTDLLKDYHIELLVPEYGHEACALRETSQGLVNFVQYSIYPPGQVLAVLGLYCSTSTKEISSLAGYESIQLIQLSAANSPIFNPVIDEVFNDAILQPTYPHLWRFLVSASVYADMMIELVNMYNWNDIILLYTTDNNFYVGIEEALSNQLSDNILLSLTTDVQFQDGALDEIKNEGGRIIFVAANSMETASLLCRAAERGMLYPDYMWIITDYVLSFLESANQCENALLHHALNGSLLSYFSLEPRNKTMKLINGDTYSTYESNYYKELDIVADEYNQALDGDHEYAAILYDQVWAFALALNNSLPELSRRNLSVSDIGSLGYSEAKEILEKELSQLDFRGASGRIRFNNKREVSTPIDLYQVINGQQKLVGNCRIDNSSVTYCNITLTEIPPSSELDVVTKVLKLPMAVIIIMYIITAITVVLITTVMVLFLYNRKRPEIKGTGWKLSILQFLACYLLCLSMILVTLQAHLHSGCIACCPIQIGLHINAINLIVIISFVRVVRVYQIFHNKRLKNLGWCYSNWFLAFISTLLSSIPVIIVMAWFFSNPQGTIASMTEIVFDDDRKYRYHLVTQLYYCTVGIEGSNIVFLVLVLTFLLTFMLANVILASQTRKSYPNVKNTKKLILLMSTMWILAVSFVSCLVIVFMAKFTDIVWTSFIYYIYCLCNAWACIFIFYVPKLFWMKDVAFKHYLLLT